MSHVNMTTHFEAPIDRVFELGTDFKRFPEWNVSYNEVKEVTGPTDQVGTKIFAVMQILGAFVEGSAEIVEVDRPRMLKLIGRGGQSGTLETIYAGNAIDTMDVLTPDQVRGRLVIMRPAVSRPMSWSSSRFSRAYQFPPTFALPIP